MPEHVLMTADAVGGVWTYAVELCRALSERGTRVTLAVMGPRASADQRIAARLVPGLAVYEREGRLEWMENPWADVSAAGEWLQRLAERLQPDLVHLNDFTHGALEWPCPSVVVAHSCVVSWWNAVHRSDPPAAWTRYRQNVRAGLAGADAAVAVSRALAQAIARHYAVPAPAVVLNGRGAREYKPARKEEFVLTCGRAWDQAKNIAALNSAAAYLPWPVRLAGDTRHPHGAPPAVDHLELLGRLSADEMRLWFSRAGIYALPALYEPFGLSVLEAALSGCALVLGDIPSLREIWQHAAIFVDGRDVDALVAALSEVIRQPEHRRDLARRSRSRALTLTPERMLTGYLGVYAQARMRYTAVREAEARCAS
jgi:glycosyltransferase involved in cell wall biosynthesis